MPENNELSPNVESKSNLEKKSLDWASELNRAREIAKVGKGRVEHLLSLEITQNPVEPPTLEELQKTFKEKESLTPENFGDSDEYIVQIAKLRAQFSAWESQQREEYSRLSELANIDIGQTHEVAEQAARDLWAFNEWYQEVAQPFIAIDRKWGEQVDQIIEQELSLFASQIRSKIELVAQQIRENTKLSASVRGDFVSTVVRKKLDRAVSNGEITSDKAEDLFRNLHAHETQDQIGDEILSDSSTDTLYEIGEDESYLQANVNSEFLDQMFEDVQNQLLDDLSRPTQGKLSDWDIDRVVFQNSKRSHRAQGNVRSADLVVLKKDNNYPLRAVRNIEMWRALSGNEHVRTIFGNETLASFEEQITDTFNKGILSDTQLPSSVSASEYFASPQLVRDLLLSTSNRDRNILYAFRSLQKSQDWPNIIEEVCKQYPELGETAEIFVENWQTFLQSTDISWTDLNDVQLQAIQRMANRILDESQLSPEQRRAALASLDTENLLKRVLKMRGQNPDNHFLVLNALKAAIEENRKVDHGVFDKGKAGFESVLRQIMYQVERIPSRHDRLSKLSGISLETALENLQLLAQKITDEKDAAKLQVLIGVHFAEFIIDDDQEPEHKRFLLEQALGIFEGRDLRLLSIVAIGNPSTYLNNEGALLLTNLSDSCDLIRGSDENRVYQYVADGTLNPQAFIKLRSELPFVFEEEWKDVWSELRHNPEVLLHNPNQISFYKQLISEHGKQAFRILSQYKDCLKENAINQEDHELILELLRHFRVLSPTILEGYRTARETNTIDVYISGLKDLSAKLIGRHSLEDADRSKSYYQDLLQHVYPNNSGNWTNYESNSRCEDRSADLNGLVLKDRYQIDLMAASEMKLITELDQDNIEHLKAVVLDIAEIAKEQEYDQEKMRTVVQNELRQIIDEAQLQGALTDFDPEKITTNNDLLFVILAEGFYGSAQIDQNRFKRLIVLHLFTEFENVQDYIQGTSDRVAGAKYPDYALLSELHNFFADRIKEAGRDIVQTAYQNPAISDRMETYFERVAVASQEHSLRDRLARIQSHKLGLSESFLEQIGKTLNKGRTKPLSPDQVVAIVNRYQRLVSTSDETTSLKKRTRAFHGQLRSQVSRTAQAISEITKENVSPDDIYLADVDIEDILRQKQMFGSGKYDEGMFASFTVQRMIGLFSDEVNRVDQELGKFEAEGGKESRLLNAYITKSKESAHARMVGGVCVSGDNPVNGRENMWDMSNFVQMVFQDPETLRCQGIVLMHIEEDSGKKILSVSLNPSSTYLYQVDEKALLSGIADTVIGFARDNSFDMVVMSKNKAIRTNRTGGIFEQSIDERLASVGEEYKFTEPRRFSFNPEYLVQETDILWSIDSLRNKENLRS